jgi:hypothetical protein
MSTDEQVTIENCSWEDRIAVTFIVKQELRRVDLQGLWPFYYPEVAATEEQLAAAEGCLGHAIDEGYRGFLARADGWKGFIRALDLFGTEDLMGSALMGHAMGQLEVIDGEGPLEQEIGFTLGELLPIAANFEDRELHVITRPTSRKPGVVIWFDGQEIERYPSFLEYYLAMADYDRYGIEYFKKIPPCSADTIST